MRYHRGVFARALSVSLLIALLLGGCDGSTSDTDGGLGDGGLGDGAADGSQVPDGIAPPAAPALPMLAESPTCPAGFQLTTTVPAFCEPWPLGEGGCADVKSIRLPGEASCRPVAPCPAGDFADGLPAEGVVYVRSGSSGDGSRAAPFGTIPEAFAVMTSPGVVAIGPGVYGEFLRVPAGVSLIGTCPERTILRSDTPATNGGVVNVDGPGVVVRGLAVTSPVRRGIRVLNMASLRLEGVVVHDVNHYGISLDDGASLETQDVVVANVVPGTGTFAVGLVYDDGSVTLRDTLIEGVSGTAVVANGGGGTLTADGLVVRGIVDDVGLGAGAIQVQAPHDVTLARTVVESNETIYGVVGLGAGVAIRLESSLVRAGTTPATSIGSGGVQATGGATLAVEGTTIRGFEGVGLWMDGAGGVLEISDSLIDSIAPGPMVSSFIGVGVAIDGADRADMRRVRVSGATGIGVIIGGGAVALLEDVLVQDTPGLPEVSDSGRGIQIGGAAQATLSRVLVESVGEVGLIVAGEGTRADGSDIVVRQTSARGINIELGATASFTRVTVDDSVEVGVACIAGAALTLSDATIRRSRAREDGRFGRAVSVQFATAELTRVHVDDYDNIGVFIGGVDTTALLNDVYVENGAGSPRDGASGDGIYVQEEGVVRGARVAVERAREVGVAALSGASIELSQLQVRETLPRRCAATTCPLVGLGHGVAAVDGSVTLVDFESVDSALCGIFLAGSGTMDLEIGRVAGAKIGACLQVDDYDLSRITDGVDYVDNETSLDSTTLPVPMPAAGVTP